MIEILKASAGSGKTWNLAKTYIKLLLENDDPYAYRHILAVTFTNKATEEMKGRILRELHTLASDPERSPYFSVFVPSLFRTSGELQKKSGTVLYNILHDYSAFSVSTIDRFFQQSLKSFSREIGQFSNYQVELDKQSVVEESVDRILDSLSEQQPDLLRWLSDSVMERLERGGKYNLKEDLLNMAMQLESDEHREVVGKHAVDDAAAYSKENLKYLKGVVRKTMKDFRNGMEAAVKAVREAFSSAGVSPDVTSRSFMSKALAKFDDIGPYGSMPGFSDAFRKNAQDYSLWFKKADMETYSGLEGILMPPVQDLLSFYDNGIKVFNTAFQIEKQINDLGIAGELSKAFAEVMKERNVICIDESNLLLKNIIDGSDAPFVYEKIGVRYEHFLLDEFQDTSRIQWDNFRSLIANSNSQNFSNLLVGDVKQSIYRWRGSDWNLMAHEVQEDFPDAKPDGMKSNWRSCRNIVEFNNSFFEYAADAIDASYGLVKNTVSSIYGVAENPKQKVCSKDSQDGSVDVVFCNKDDELDKTYETVMRVLDAGAKAGDIAILVRNNQDGSAMAAYLIDKGVDVISDDSLNLKSSSVVRKLVSLISAIGNPENEIGAYIAQKEGLDVGDVHFHSLMDLCEKLLRTIRENMEESDFNDEILYVQSFMDYVQDFSAVNGNALNAFLKNWEESSPKVSSPNDENAVRVMTIHKSKGLEFPYVIFPFAEKVGLFRNTNRWIVPDVEGTPLECMGKTAFNVPLSGGSTETLFEKEYREEAFLQYVDNINTFYVALTRPANGLTVIASGGEISKDGSFRSFSGILESYMESGNHDFKKTVAGEVTTYSKGTLYDFTIKHKKEAEESAKSEDKVRVPGFPSFGIEDESGNVRKDMRLRISEETMNFFSDEAKERNEAIRNGTVLHNILASVISQGDLPAAVEKARLEGVIDSAAAAADLKFLSERIAAHPEWFPESGAAIFNEVPVFDVNGEEYIPDRVLIKDGKVTVIDYKFGERELRYRNQVSRYVDIYRRMGYTEVSGFIWYVREDVVE